MPPSHAPTEKATAAPSMKMTNSPTSNPSRTPVAFLPAPKPRPVSISPSPVSEPTFVPTNTVSVVQTSAPIGASGSNHTLAPTVLTTMDPTSAISTRSPVTPISAPTFECKLNLNISCVIGSGRFSGQPCETPGIGVEPCLEAPTGSTMLYNGGSCAQSDNRQFLKTSCQDYEAGPPPTEKNTSSYIVVTDARGKGIVYHEGYVRVGTTYYLRTPEGEEKFEADQIISIYSSNETSDDNLQQRVIYHSSCSNNLELKSRFGASQLVEFVNDIQGNVTCFAAATFDLGIVIPLSIDGGNSTITSVTAVTSFADFLNLTSQVSDLDLLPGASASVVVPAEFDLTARKRYTVFVEAYSEDSEGQQCHGAGFLAFYAGNPTPALVPTPLPTVNPTISPAPTSDVQTTACSIKAEIVCKTLDSLGRVSQDCESVIDPSGVSCTDGFTATGVGFQYLGVDDLPEVVFVAISGGRTGTVFLRPVRIGQYFYAEGDFRGNLQIDVYSRTESNSPGEQLRTFDIDADCDIGDTILTLGQNIGPFELTTFRNALGTRTSVYNVRLQYFVQNDVSMNMILEDGVISSSFIDDGIPFQTVGAERIVNKRERVRLFEETTMVNFKDKFLNQTQFNFTLTASGRGAVSSIACSSLADLSF